jgi:hypothetical protein
MTPLQHESQLLRHLLSAHTAVEIAQLSADNTDRAGLGRELDPIRWQLEDFIAKYRVKCEEVFVYEA